MADQSVKFPLRVILLSGLLVGTLDILSAFVDVYISGKAPLLVLNFVAMGAFGKTTLSTGITGEIFGLLFHYIIAFAFTFLFFALYTRSEIMRRSWVITGIVYGIFIWIIMNLIVVRLSRIPSRPLSAIQLKNVLKGGLILITMIGLPLSFIAHRYQKNNRGYI
jgi:hypothetical protein